MRRAAIVGSRYTITALPGTLKNLRQQRRNLDVQQKICDLIESLRPLQELLVISGGAPGVDCWAVDYAGIEYGAETVVHHADWKNHGRGAGIVRNGIIVEDADEVYAFWDGQSSGTKNTIERARAAGKLKKVEVTPL